MQIGSKIDAVIYGNPVLWQSEILSRVFYLDTLYEPMQHYPFPANSSDTAKKELSAIAALVRKTNGTQDVLERALNIHFNFDHFWQINVFEQGRFDPEVVKEINSDVDNIVTKLKFFYNRPRPYQLAAYYKLALFPETTTGVESPAYPCGSYLKSLLYTYVLANQISYEKFENVTDLIMKSLIGLGFHYPSDMKFSYTLYQAIIKHKGFVNKYELDIQQ